MFAPKPNGFERNPKIIAPQSLPPTSDALLRPDMTLLHDLHNTRQAIRHGETSASNELERAITIAQSPACDHVWRQIRLDAARDEAAQADSVNAAARNGLAQPLAGLSISVKDLFDVAGQNTPAGSTALAYSSPALADAPAVARLRAAGGVLLGRTNMVEFAFSGVGINPHFDTPAAWDAQTGTAVGSLGDGPRVPGGSSSGAGVSVATGAAFVGLGSDTGGSIRIPAALNGIVGFKNTARLVPTTGAVPLSTTLDTACAMTRSVRDAVLVHEILSARAVLRCAAPLASYRLAVPQTTFLDGLDATVAQAFERSLQVLRAAGAQIEEIPLAEMQELGDMQARAGFSAVESFAWHRPLLAQRAASYDPRVRSRIERGAAMAAADYAELVQARAAWITHMLARLQPFDALLSPTVPIVGPTIASIAPGAERDEAFFRTNNLLLRNPSAINMLDGCALSLPCHAPGELPVGLMVWHGALHDDTVLNVSLQIEKTLNAIK